MKLGKVRHLLLESCLWLFITPIAALEPSQSKPNWFIKFYDDVLCDYSTYYHKDNLTRVGGTLFIAGILANGGIDNGIKHFWQDNIRSKTTDRFLKPQKEIGFFNYKKVYIGTIVLGYWMDDYVVGHAVYQWGYRSFRGLLLGSPQVTALRHILGGGRPIKRCQNQASHPYSKSNWRFFTYGRPSCSGHTFNGALPFLTAAMMTERPVYRYGLYALSTLPGIARINANKHYFSQVLLGWSIAYFSAKVVDISDKDKEENSLVKVEISEVRDGTMVHTKMRF